SPDMLQGGDDAQRTVERPTIGHAVKMRPGPHRRTVGPTRRAQEDVAVTVGPHAQPRLRRPLRQPGTRPPVGHREAGTGDPAPLVRTEPRQLLQITPQPVDVHPQIHPLLPAWCPGPAQTSMVTRTVTVSPSSTPSALRTSARRGRR